MVGSLQSPGGIFLGANEVVAAFLHDDLNGVVFVVQRVGSDQGVGELHPIIGEQGECLRDFAVFFFARGWSHGHWPSILMPAKCDDHPASAITHAFAVQSQTARQQPGVGLQPGREGLSVGLGINGSQKVVERVITGHLEPLGLLVAHPQPDGLSLALGQACDLAPDIEHIACAHDQA